MQMWSPTQVTCRLCNLRGPSPYQLISHKCQHQQLLCDGGVLPWRPGFLSHISSIMEWSRRLTRWPFDGTHQLISPPSARQLTGQVSSLEGGLMRRSSPQFSTRVEHLDVWASPECCPNSPEMALLMIIQVLVSVWDNSLTEKCSWK